MIGKCNDEQLMNIALHILRGLDYMHSKGYIHRDIKPANLLCHYDERNDDEKKEAIYKLGDLGCSKNINDSIVQTYTGTIKFMAPEIKQIQNNTSYDEKVDIWSLGATLLCLGEGHNFVIDSNCNPKFINIKDHILKKLICRCLIADPKKRYAANELLKKGWSQKNSSRSQYTKNYSVWNGALGSVFLCKEIFTDNDDWEDIKKEKLNLEMLNSPHIIKLIDHFESKEEKLYRLIFEYCSGGCLTSMIGECNDGKLLMIGLHVLRGLHYMHSRGYIHRDIRPPNLFCHYIGDEKKEAIYKLGDLGRSKNIFTGTMKFMAPEIKQMPNKGSYDEKVDIWSLGAALLCLGEGHHFMICSNPKFINIKDDILKHLICRCLIADPKKRYTANGLLEFMDILSKTPRLKSNICLSSNQSDAKSDRNDFSCAIYEVEGKRFVC